MALLIIVPTPFVFRDNADASKIISVTMLRIPYGGSINQPVNLTLRTSPEYVFITTSQHSFSFKQFTVHMCEKDPEIDTALRSILSIDRGV
ncbi:hypothetical protein TNCV_1252961 [Trichonephila clavipes]|nr:hypothetical protein TNCV_1252961 [Trichonephila clavipes]